MFLTGPRNVDSLHFRAKLKHCEYAIVAGILKGDTYCIHY